MTIRNSMIPNLAYDGGHIDIIWDNHEKAVEWYNEFTGWGVEGPFIEQKNNGQPFKSRKKTRLWYGTWLVSFLTDHKIGHLAADRGTVDPHVRWCWGTRKLAETHDLFVEKGIRITPLYTGPDGGKYFDFWATFEGTRLTAYESLDLPVDSPRFGTGRVRIGVTDLKSAIEWYKEYIGMGVHEDRSQDGYVIMKLALEHHPEHFSTWCLEQLQPGAFTGKVDGPARPYVVVHDNDAFNKYHRFLHESGVAVSDIWMEGFQSYFHLYDPDGNRFNVTTY